MTFADTISVRLTTIKLKLLYNLLLICTGSLLMALSAQIEIPLGFTPVPITGQTFAVLLIGALFGSRRGALAVCTYLIEGISGLPVFAGGAFGIVHLFGPTGGYLIGFIPAAFMVGFLAERGWDRNIVKTIFSMLLGYVIIFVCGLSWLSTFVGTDRVLELGFIPFIIGIFVKVAAASAVLPSIRHFK
jgi:biotin transport system substrate-specific component